MEEPKNNDVRSGELVPQQVTVNPKFANLARVEFTESWASPAELQQGFWRLAEFFLDLVGTNRVIARYEIGETIDVFPRLGSPFYAHAARVTRARALRR